MINKSILKRYSTYANLVAMVVSGILISIGNFGFDSNTTATIMLGGNVLVAVCQFIRQEAAK